jgi:hypothetical protein
MCEQEERSFTPRKKVKFGLEVLAPSVQEIKLEASMEVQNLLEPRWTAIEGSAHALTGKAWEALCTYVKILNDKLPELQEIMANLEEVPAGRLLGVEDELGGDSGCAGIRRQCTRGGILMIFI